MAHLECIPAFLRLVNQVCPKCSTNIAGLGEFATGNYMTISQAREKFNISTPMVIDIGAYNEDTAALIKQRLAQGQPISPALLHSANQQALQPYIAPQAPGMWPLANQQGIQPYTSAVAPQPQGDFSFVPLQIIIFESSRAQLRVTYLVSWININLFRM